MKIEHLVTKRIQKGQRRLFFHCKNESAKPFGGKIEVKLLAGFVPVKKITAFADAITPGFYSVFYADVPVALSALWTSFSWSWGMYEGEGEKSDKFEKVY